jgi:membrane protein
MFAHFDLQIGGLELLRRTYRDAMRDDALGLAAQLAYYFFLALFPALLCLMALASLFPIENLTDEVVNRLAPVAPAAVVEIVRGLLLSIAAGGGGELFSLGLLGAIWSSSAAIVSVIGAMNRAYDIDETRPWWKVRLTAIALTIGLAAFILLSFTLVVAGPEIAEGIARRFGLAGAFVWTWNIGQWFVILFLVSLGIGMIYYFAPDAEQDWVWITPGSLLATLLWVAGSLGFRLYVVNFGDYETSYGAIGGIIVLLLWFYLSGLAIIIGAEMNAEIEHASPWGKDPGEKAPGEKRAIGPAASRRWYRRRPRQGQDGRESVPGARPRPIAPHEARPGA